MRARYRTINLPVRRDSRGSLSFGETPQHIPFMPKRIFTLFDLAEGAERGGHAHRAQHQFLIMMCGMGEIEIDDGAMRTNVVLNSPEHALYVPPMLWLDLHFSKGSVCTVLASDVYDESDYIRDYQQFTELANQPSAE